MTDTAELSKFGDSLARRNVNPHARQRMTHLCSRRRHLCLSAVVSCSFGLAPVLALAATLILCLSSVGAAASLTPSDVVILVNANSPVSQSVADLYRRYHPEIAASRVLSLGGVPTYPAGLPDCASLTSTAADEIITRDQFEKLIAQPLRDYLINNNLVSSIYCIITTAGMPYRIEDIAPALADVVYPAGSNATLTLTNRTSVNAASVESDLSVLFGIDPALAPGTNPYCDSCPGIPLNNRIINPYHGYKSGIKDWQSIRDIMTRRTTFHWNFTNLWAITAYPQPRIEGLYTGCGCSAASRIMSPADIYLVARLDGPHVQGQYPIFAIKDMLDRAAAVGDLNSYHFVGYSAAKGALVIDHAPPPTAELANTKAYNFTSSTTTLTYETNPVPPGRESYSQSCSPCAWGGGNHFKILYQWLTGVAPTSGTTGSLPIINGFGGTCVWDDTTTIMSSANAAYPVGAGLIGLITYGTNGGDGRPARYLLTSGPGGGNLFKCAPGAAFGSIESFNAVTMFTDVVTSQAKIAEFIQMGGSAAVGHAFEPGVDAIDQDEFLFRNLLRDDDADGIGDLCLAEAMFTALPYLSWSEVVIGDPLMRLRTGPGGLVSLVKFPGDADGDAYTGPLDLNIVLDAYNQDIGQPWYDPAADLDQDGYVGAFDLNIVVDHYGVDFSGQ